MTLLAWACHSHCDCCSLGRVVVCRRHKRYVTSLAKRRRLSSCNLVQRAVRDQSRWGNKDLCVCWQFCENEEPLGHVPTAVRDQSRWGNKGCVFGGNSAGTKEPLGHSVGSCLRRSCLPPSLPGKPWQQCAITDVLPSPMQ